MKRFNYFGISLLMAVMLFISCSGNKSDLSVLIPKDSYVVVNMNLGKLYDKGNFKDFDKTQLYAQVNGLLSMFQPETGKILTELATNSKGTGIDVKGEMYGYANDNYVGILIPIKDKSKFNDFLKRNQSADKKEEPRKIEQFLAVGGDNSSLVAWNDNVIYFLQGMKSQAKQQMETDLKAFAAQKKETSIESHPFYEKFISGKKDISVMMDLEKIYNTADATAKATSGLGDLPLLSQVSSMMRGSYTAFYTEFNNDVVDVMVETKASDEMKKMFDYDKLYKKSMSDRLLKLIPGKAFIVASMAVEPSEMAKGYKEMLSKITKDNNSESSALINTIFASFDKYINRLDGEMVFALNDITESADMFSPSVPEFSFIIGTKDNNILTDIVKDIPLLKIKGNYLEIPTGTEIGTLYITNANNLLYITNNMFMTAVAVKGECEDNITKSPYMAQLKSGMFFLMNLNFDNFPDGIKAQMSSDFVKPLADKLNIFEAFTVENVKTGETMKGSLKLKKHNQNALLTLFQAIEKAAGGAMAGGM